MSIDARSLVRARRASLARHTAAGTLFEANERGFHCTACAHRCELRDGQAGICGVRTRNGDVLEVPFGYVARKYVRAVETNTIFHVRPGKNALTFGMYGCDLKCGYCHNWRLSQAHREPEAGGPLTALTAEELADEAVRTECAVVCAAYNEPLISAEWVHAVFTEAKRRGLVTAVITDGHSTPETLGYLRPVTDVFRVDLKAADEASYRTLGGHLKPVLASIATARRLGYWVEVVTLVVPGFSDDPRALRNLADALFAIDPAIPWHLNAFQPRYRMLDRGSPSKESLWLAAGAAYARGLSFVYVGNVADDALATTRCPKCHGSLIERHDYRALRVELDAGRCPSCATDIPGLW